MVKLIDVIGVSIFIHIIYIMYRSYDQPELLFDDFYFKNQAARKIQKWWRSTKTDQMDYEFI